MSLFKRKSKNEKEKRKNKMAETLNVKDIEKNAEAVNSGEEKKIKKVQVANDVDSSYAPLVTEPFPKSKIVYYKPPVSKKLTVILVENTAKVLKEKEMLVKIVKNLVPTGLICIINYGSIPRQSKIIDISSFDDTMFLCDDIAGDVACLYDALIMLDGLILEKYMTIEEINNQRININQCDVVGIGTCKDIGSVFSKEDAIQCFCRVSKRAGITTKYFCLTEENFMDAAEIGFHSIGAIFRNY